MLPTTRAEHAQICERAFHITLCYTPFTYTDFSYESLRIAQTHGSFTDPYDLATFTTDLRVITSCLRFITDYYELLRCIYGNSPRFVTSLSRITTINLRVTNDLFTCCYE